MFSPSKSMLKSIHLHWWSLSSLIACASLRPGCFYFKLASFFDYPVPSLDLVFCNNLIFHFIILCYCYSWEPRWGNSYSQVVQNKEEWSRLIGYGSGLEIHFIYQAWMGCSCSWFPGKMGWQRAACFIGCSARWVLWFAGRRSFFFQELVGGAPNLIVIVAKRSRPNLMLWKGQAQAGKLLTYFFF